MATLGITRPTLLDVTKRLDPNGSIATVGEILSEQNAVLDDIFWKEGNLPTGHKFTLRTSEPAVSWRKLNQGVAPTKSSTSQYTETTGSLVGYNEVDRKIADLNGNTSEFRLSESKSTMEKMNKEFAEALIYGDVLVTPEELTGIIPRYASLSGTTADKIIDAGGVGADNTSILLVCWGDDSVYGIYPKGSKSGLIFEDKGLVTLQDASSNPFEGYRSYFEWNCGLCVKDWRYIVRIANIDVSALLTAGDGTDTSANILKFMLMAIHKIPNLSAVRPVFYMNETVLSMLDVKLFDKGNAFLKVEDLVGAGGFPRPSVMHFRGIPCRKVDQMLSDEARVT